jgi:hypothetical protein
MGVTPGRVSQIERGELATIDAVARCVQTLGGELDLTADRVQPLVHGIRAGRSVRLTTVILAPTPPRQCFHAVVRA